MNPRFVWPAVSLAAASMLAVAVMAIAGVDRETIVILAAMLVTPILGTLIAGQVSNVQGTANAVVQQTNGQQSRLIDILESQGRMLAAMQPMPPAPVAAPGSDDRTSRLAA